VKESSQSNLHKKTKSLSNKEIANNLIVLIGIWVLILIGLALHTYIMG